MQALKNNRAVKEKVQWTLGMQKANAFTLVELLVLMGVIGVLTALTLSVASKINNKSAMRRSTANLKQISMGIHLYTSENRGQFPDSGTHITVRDQRVRYWFNALSYYIDGTEDMVAASLRAERPAWQLCPARPFKELECDSGGYGISIGYGWNYRYFGYNSKESIYLYGWKSLESQVELPAQTIIVGTNQEKDAEGVTIRANDARNLWVYANRPSSARFNGYGLYLFVDGHVRSLTPKQAMENDSYLFKKLKTGPYPEDNTPR